MPGEMRDGSPGRRSMDSKLMPFTTFLCGVILSLLAAWATHSTSKEDLNTAITNQSVVNAANLDNVKSSINILSGGQDRLWLKLDTIQSQIDKLRGK